MAGNFSQLVDPSKGFVMGRGKGYFTEFDDYDAMTIPKGVPSEFLGNIPSLGLTINVTNYDHFDSTGGIREKDATVPLQVDRSSAFTVEKISATNMSRYFLGSASVVTQAAAKGYTEVIDTAYLDRTYHVGVTSDNPLGVSLLSNFALYKGSDATGTLLTPSSDYVYDAANGTFKLLASSGNLKGDGTESLFVQTDLLAAQRTISASGNRAVRGRLDFIADSAYGKNVNFMMPNVTLRPNGELQLIGDAFMAVPFTMDIGKNNDLAALYAEGQAVELK